MLDTSPSSSWKENKLMTLRTRSILAMFVLIPIAACGGKGGGEPGEASAVTLRMASALEASHPHIRCGTKPLAEWLTEQDVGIDLQVFPGSQLGSDQEATEQVARGDLDLNITTFATLSQYHAPLSVLDAAFVIKDVDHLEAVLEGKIGDELSAGLLKESNIRLLGAPFYGTRHVTSQAPVTSPDDLSGVKMRAIDEPLFVANVAVLGAQPTPIPIAELYLGLQQGVVDAQENPIPTIASLDFMSVQSNLSLTGHVTMSLAWLINEQAFQSLTAEQQETLQEGVSRFSQEVRACVEADTEKFLEEWKNDPKIKVTEADDIDRDAFEKRAESSLPDKFREEWGDLYERISAVDS